MGSSASPSKTKGNNDQRAPDTAVLDPPGAETSGTETLERVTEFWASDDQDRLRMRCVARQFLSGADNETPACRRESDACSWRLSGHCDAPTRKLLTDHVNPPVLLVSMLVAAPRCELVSPMTTPNRSNGAQLLIYVDTAKV